MAKSRKTGTRTTARKTTKKRVSSPSKSKSLQARKQKRHSDGTFAKGFKQHASPKRTTTTGTTRKTGTIKTTTKSTPVKRTSSNKGRTRVAAGKRKYTPAMRAAERSFNFDCTEATKTKVLKTVTDNFSKEEIKKIDQFGKPLVVNKDPADECMVNKNGGYERPSSDNEKKTATIILKTHPSEMTVTHELVHHLRTVDDRRDNYAKTAYPIDKRGVVDSNKNRGGQKPKTRNAEETATVAETELRTKNKSTRVSGYWAVDKYDIDGHETRDADRRTMRSGEVKEKKNVTDQKAIDMVNKNYPKTIISSRRVGGETALSTFKKIFRLRKEKKW